jgi:hypothetical protein
MTIERAIRAAIEGERQAHPVMRGFELDNEDGDTAWFVLRSGTLERSHYSINLHEIFLDLLFWQSLDKQIAMEAFLKSDIMNGYYEPRWLELWHRFIDHLARGKTAEAFFAEL